MSRTIKGTKPPGFEYWSKRPASCYGFGKKIKQRTREQERMQSKDLVREEIKEIDNGVL